MKLSEEFRREMTLCNEAAVPVWERAAEMAERYEQSHIALVENLRGLEHSMRQHAASVCSCEDIAEAIGELLPPEKT